MKEYWNNRFLNEHEIWGKRHSKTAELCLRHFLHYGIKSILIPGSGYGRNAGYFIENDIRVEGIEIAEEAIKIANSYGTAFPIFKGSVLEMPLSPKKYDGIYCFNVLHLFKLRDRQNFIEKCYEQVADGGIVFFAVFSEQELSFGKGKKIEDNTFETKPERPVHYFTNEDLRAHFTRFSIIDGGLMEDFESHGEEGPHTHSIRYIIAQKKIK
jgi:SAM-dependent methyltransferase